MKIGNTNIGQGHTYIIAELSGNHNQSFDLAVETVKAVATTGADALKLQTYTPDTITLDSDLPHFQTRKDEIWAGHNYYQLYQKAYTPWEWQPELMKLANSLGMDCFSSPFDFTAVDFLEQYNVPAYKIASFEIMDIPLIEYTASKGKPIIISTGIAGQEDIELAIQACRKVGNDQIILLKCTSEYPAPWEKANLNTIPMMRDLFKVPVGLSDHTPGYIAPVTSIGLGACVIEKHVILDRSLGGVDSSFSMDIAEFTEMVKAVRIAEKTLGEATLEVTESMMKSRVNGRSILAIRDIQPGEELTMENIRSLRPGIGLPPKHLPEVLGRKAAKLIVRGTPLQWDLIQG